MMSCKTKAGILLKGFASWLGARNIPSNNIFFPWYSNKIPALATSVTVIVSFICRIAPRICVMDRHPYRCFGRDA